MRAGWLGYEDHPTLGEKTQVEEESKLPRLYAPAKTQLPVPMPMQITVLMEKLTAAGVVLARKPIGCV